MKFESISGSLDIGFSDVLQPGVGQNVGGRTIGDCAASMTGSSFVVSITAGVIWIKDVNGTYSGIAGSLVRQVSTGSTVTLATNGSTNPRVDTVVARLGGGWGSAPTFNVVQGTATSGATARNMSGAAALSSGDVPLAVILVPANNGYPSAFGARVSNGNAEDARRLAADLSPVGTQKHHAGSAPPVGYKFEDGSVYASITNGPWNDLVTEIGNAFGSVGQVPDSRGRVRIGAGSGSAYGASNHPLGETPSGSGVKGGEESHTLTTTEIPYHTHGSGSLTTNSATPTVTINDPGHSHNVIAVNDGGIVGNDPNARVGIDTAGGAGTGDGIARQTHSSYYAGLLANNTYTGITASQGPHFHAISGITDGGTGGGGAHNIMQPHVASNAIIKF